jgi:hypothetical protein
MTGVTASLALTLAARLTGAAVGGDVPQYTANVNFERSIDPGTAGLDQADVLYHAARTLAASATEDLDLAGVLASALGATLSYAEITGVIIEADEGNTNDVVWGPTASVGALGPFGDLTDRAKVGPGDICAITNRKGWPVTATTADKWTVANGGSGTPVTYTITIIGRTVAA